MIMKQIKLFLLLMSGKKMISYRWSAVSIVRGKLKNVSGNYMLVKQFSSKKSQTILMTLML